MGNPITTINYSIGKGETTKITNSLNSNREGIEKVGLLSGNYLTKRCKIRSRKNYVSDVMRSLGLTMFAETITCSL